MSYALITGASSGIGRCYAHELAKHGYNIISVSNREEELQSLREELCAKYGIEVICICNPLRQVRRKI